MDANLYYAKLFGIADNTKSVSIAELEMMLPFEIEIYTGLLIQRQKRDEQIRQQRK